jgi:hypothetical protein
MKAITKRDLVRRPSIVSHLKPGQSLAVEDGKVPLLVSRPKTKRLTADEIEAELQRLGKDQPAMNCQEILNDLRG